MRALLFFALAMASNALHTMGPRCQVRMISDEAAAKRRWMMKHAAEEPLWRRKRTQKDARAAEELARRRWLAKLRVNTALQP